MGRCNKNQLACKKESVLGIYEVDTEFEGLVIMSNFTFDKITVAKSESVKPSF